MSGEPLVLERTFDVSADCAWDMLIDPKRMKQWHFDIPNFRAEVGATFEFWAGPERRQYRHLCKVTEVLPKKRLAYTWSYDGFTGNSLLSFDLFDEGAQTRIVLTYAGLESFPVDKPEFARANFLQGWTYFVDAALKNYIEQQHA